MFRYTKKTLAIEVIVLIATAIMLLPFWILLVGSFKTLPDILSSAAVAPPTSPTFDNFIQLLSPASASSGNIWAGLASSVIITAGSILLLVGLGSVAAYGIARSTSRWSRRSFYLFLVAIILPTQLGTLPLYIGARDVGLVGNPWGMILIYTGMLLPLSVFLYANFFRNLTPEYEEAAIIDGANRYQVFRKVVFPLMSPATGTVAILAGLIVWNDFFTSLIFLNGTAWQTLPVVMYSYVGSLVSQWNLIFAVVIVSMIPILAFYAFAQKKFIQGYAGGLKG
ncbi:carbohydrate ABC transporter permease [Leifsonia sp. TF02-11]|uniref:carbohydrate ABC transporter permease n=1 Tax=Leifsonia sp. TF02-11 TaxID=2815212 RepID=UPI001AA12EE6|nr:carbohydrate ABC transporter permease [Leifsonia sp. TF02-11]MBN9630480.1 carbohydrate ABC transporter permease [Actinomycetota bacterium]MBO1741807.1 carbohydrate ABC transporter permease [Leifsonia sp. TF02-11]